jgi:hypothetical protein
MACLSWVANFTVGIYKGWGVRWWGKIALMRKVADPKVQVAVHFAHCNTVRIHQMLRCAPIQRWIGGIMPWYRGVECKTCKQKLALARLSGPEEGPLEPLGSSHLVGAEITCPECRAKDFYRRTDFMTFKTLDPITVGPSQVTPESKPN